MLKNRYCFGLLFILLLCSLTVAWGQENPPVFKVYVFFLPDCPICKNYISKLNQIHGEIKSQGGEMCLVYVKAHYNKKEIRDYQQQQNLEVPFINDKRFRLAKKMKAGVAPSCFLMDAKGKILYKGAIDDRYTDVGKTKSRVSQEYLKAAITAYVKGTPLLITETAPYGCFIQ